MKGVVFTEFLEMVEQVFSPDMVDDIIDASDLPSGGAYTAVGTYPHAEMVSLVVALSEKSEIPVDQLLKTYGRHLFSRFAVLYPGFFSGLTSSFALLSGIENVIHAEVRKLYPDADLPTFTVEHSDDNQLVLVYQSARHFEDLAEGLIEGCICHFKESITCERQTIGSGDSRSERFTLRRI